MRTLKKRPRVGDRVTEKVCWVGDKDGSALRVGTVIAIYRRYYVLEFKHGIRECFKYLRKSDLQAAAEYELEHENYYRSPKKAVGFKKGVSTWKES